MVSGVCNTAWARLVKAPRVFDLLVVSSVIEYNNDVVGDVVL